MHDPNSCFFPIDKYYDASSLSFSRKDEGEMLLLGNRWRQALEKEKRENAAVEPQTIDRSIGFVYVSLSFSTFLPVFLLFQLV